VFSDQTVTNDHVSDLFDLIRLGQPDSRLKVQDLLDAIARENVVVTSDTLIKAKSLNS
jgi:hypothetical protein